MSALNESVKRAGSSERPAGLPPDNIAGSDFGWQSRPEGLDTGGAGQMPQGIVDGPARGAGGARSVEGRLLAHLLEHLGNPPVEFILWTGEHIAPAGAAIIARVRVSSRATLLGILADPQVRFPDAYSEGRVEIEGDLVRLMEEVYHSGRRSPQPSALRRLVERLHRPHVNTLSGSRENIHHHYDIGNDFYSLWLGQTMAYTCAYYPTPATTLDAAQTAKMDHVCRKLRLRAGESVLEAGCGWGTLAVHMASHYGVKVRAFNISREQVAFARARAASLGLSSQVEYVEDDYRNASGRYDAFVSVGMLEHVGVANYTALGQVIARSIGTHGRGLIHSIGRNFPAALQPWIEKRIFPGACPPSLAQMMQIFEPYDFSVLDVENLRLHYARTLHDWLALFEAASGRVREMFDEKFVRMWRMYLAGSIAGFTTGALQLFQVVFAPRDNNDVPMTREHLYVR
ncbi:MAG TPA: cyclopropane-fatty-acyl-phospholipid synthase family protein [Steroidobacteraceae bacterium]|nr:cyclopropane-fatty-acyl-phospholipid synthase family protein [Steroidobacteraceae bacterium]